MRCIPILFVLLASVAGCGPGPRAAPRAEIDADRAAAGRANAAFRQAADLSEDGELAAALETLALALEEGYPTPSRVLVDGRYRALIDDDDLRPRVRELLDGHAREHRIRMTRPDEPGAPLTVTIRLVDDATGAPVALAKVGVVQVDDRGYYVGTGEETGWNPRLFGFARTDAAGVAVVHTIRPAHYGPAYEVDDEPAHIHYNLSRDGYRPHNAEFFFDDDRRVTEAMRTPEAQARTPIATVQVDADGAQTADVTITMQRAADP